MLTRVLIAFGAFCVLVAPSAPQERPADSGLLIPTSQGRVRLDAEATRRYLETDEYLRLRLDEVEEIREGVPYSEVAKLFTEDGGISSPPPHRFVNILCPFIKLDIAFEGEEEREPYKTIPDDARVRFVSRAYFEHPYSD